MEDFRQLTAFTYNDLQNAITDEYGVKYSADGKKLLDFPLDIKTLIVRDGTQAICDRRSEAGIALNLTRVELPDSLTAIGSAAFMAAIHLEEINWPKSLKYIGDSAFCTTALKSIILPEGLVYLGRAAFKDCSNAKAAVVPEGITELNDLVFNHCEALISLTLPKSLERIGEWAVSSCKVLQFITIPDDEGLESHFKKMLDGYYNRNGNFSEMLLMLDSNERSDLIPLINHFI